MARTRSLGPPMPEQRLGEFSQRIGERDGGIPPTGRTICPGISGPTSACHHRLRKGFRVRNGEFKLPGGVNRHRSPTTVWNRGGVTGSPGLARYRGRSVHHPTCSGSGVHRTVRTSGMWCSSPPLWSPPNVGTARVANGVDRVGLQRGNKPVEHTRW